MDTIKLDGGELAEGKHHAGPTDAPVWLTDGWDDDTPPAEPELIAVDGGVPLLYAGKSHVLFGLAGSGKSFFAQHGMAQVVAGGDSVLYLDYESDRRTVRDRMRALGVTQAGADLIAYWRLTAPLDRGAQRKALAAWLARHRPTLAVLDGVSKAMTSAKLKENQNPACHTWDATVVQPLVQQGITVLLIDHVSKPAYRPVKGSELFARGGGAKVESVTGVAYRFEAVTEWTRTSDGRAKIIVAKDREGHRRKSEVAAIIDVAVADAGQRVFFAVRAPSGSDAAATDGGSAAACTPTAYMERVSRWLEGRTDPASRNAIEASAERGGVGGKRDYVRQALDALVKQGYVTTQPGTRGHLTHVSTKPYRCSEGRSPGNEVA
jgi:hypothetical protein